MPRTSKSHICSINCAFRRCLIFILFDINALFHLLSPYGRIFDSCSIYPYWQLFRNFSFLGHRSVSGKLIHKNFMIQFFIHLFSFCKISGYESGLFLENSSIKFWLNALFWMTLPGIGLCYALKFKNWRLDEFSSNRCSSYPRNVPIRVKNHTVDPIIESFLYEQHVSQTILVEPVFADNMGRILRYLG